MPARHSRLRSIAGAAHMTATAIVFMMASAPVHAEDCTTLRHRLRDLEAVIDIRSREIMQERQRMESLQQDVTRLEAYARLTDKEEDKDNWTRMRIAHGAALRFVTQIREQVAGFEKDATTLRSSLQLLNCPDEPAAQNTASPPNTEPSSGPGVSSTDSSTTTTTPTAPPTVLPGVPATPQTTTMVPVPPPAPPRSGNSDDCDLVRQRLAWIDDQLERPQDNLATASRAYQDWRADLVRQRGTALKSLADCGGRDGPQRTATPQSGTDAPPNNGGQGGGQAGPPPQNLPPVIIGGGFIPPLDPPQPPPTAPGGPAAAKSKCPGAGYVSFMCGCPTDDSCYKPQDVGCTAAQVAKYAQKCAPPVKSPAIAQPVRPSPGGGAAAAAVPALPPVTGLQSAVIPLAPPTEPAAPLGPPHVNVYEPPNSGQGTGPARSKCAVAQAHINDKSPNAQTQMTVGANDQCRTAFQWSTSTTVSLANAPAHGRVSLEGSSALVYTPNPGYQGSDAFAISVRWGGHRGRIGYAVTVR
jgi:hypothetical protein